MDADLGLQGFGGVLGRVVAVQAVDQPVGAGEPPGVEGEQTPQLRPAERDGCPVGAAGFDRPEDGEPPAVDSRPGRPVVSGNDRSNRLYHSRPPLKSRAVVAAFATRHRALPAC
ncbi:hypothetical protein [Amycolatopsis japonica]|uniref:hypothetical protein n=1 Tax=Amycolatopsis japonica TaxID=208439 RepID=UPI003D9E995C